MKYYLVLTHFLILCFASHAWSVTQPKTGERYYLIREEVERGYQKPDKIKVQIESCKFSQMTHGNGTEVWERFRATGLVYEESYISKVSICTKSAGTQFTDYRANKCNDIKDPGLETTPSSLGNELQIFDSPEFHQFHDLVGRGCHIARQLFALGGKLLAWEGYRYKWESVVQNEKLKDDNESGNGQN